MPGFTEQRWQAINKELSRRPKRYGLPIRRSSSVVIGSFNALKLGKASNSAKRWEFLTKFVSRFDLLAVQEIMDDLSGIRRLHQSLGSSYKLVVSDTTGAFPGDGGLRERLAFLYRPSRVRLNELVSDITYDRSRIVRTLRNDISVWGQFFQRIDDENKLRRDSGKKPKSLSQYAHPAFTTFIRTPHCASFTILGRGNAEPIEFLGVNAHALYGNHRDERAREFYALLDWLVQRAKARERMYSKNMILMGDLNMDFDDPATQFSDIVRRLHELNSSFLTGNKAARANFPFLDVHPDSDRLFSTNARRNQTFDHVAFFVDRTERGLSVAASSTEAGQQGLNGYDYGVFDFAELFSQSIHNTSFEALTVTKRDQLLSKAKADVSDHLPIWVRIPIPGAS